MFEETVSRFETFDSAPENIKLDCWLRATMNYNCKFVEKVKSYRSTGKEYFKTSLPTITPGAVCEDGHSMDHVVGRTGWISLDIDAKDNPNYSPSVLKNAISNSIYVAFCGLSVSGEGVWALVKVNDPKKQASYFRQLQEDFKRRYIILDSTKGKNPNDLRFYSFDPNAYLADEFKVYDRLPRKIPDSRPRPKSHRLTTHTEGNDTQSKVEALISEIQVNRIDITIGYEIWRNLGFALQDEFGEKGRNYFHMISQYHPDYTRKETNSFYTRWIKRSGSGVGIATFFYWCKEYGITFSKKH